MNATSANQTGCPELKVPAPLFLGIGVASLAENLLVVLAVIWNRNLHSPMYAFICSLAAFNTIASLTKTWETLMILFADVGRLQKGGAHETRLDDVVDALMCMSFVGSFFSFLAIAVDRYITIFYALRYHNIMTAWRTRLVLGAIWTTCGVCAVLMVRFFDSNFIMICFIALFVVSLAMICFFYVYMFMLARIHARRIAALPSHGGGRCGRRRWRRRSARGALTLTLLFGAFVVCWAPFFLHLIIIMACPTNPYCECYRSLFQLHVALLMSHALVDPAIYAFRSAELRHTFRKMLLCSDCG
ncbi:adrenocorticotropic hormone receptor [Betta splendens]|uniref:Melanocyte-stimulating hormone receptor n=1 Tax=Betta splendens TaxID=158456 RepID=A0A8M1H5S1_BETSP|nr:adrenocorticotropic hormone receptor [Betta splendens]XP_055359231.1 adrenocorticotropic hormone receptor [Betta splendens]XP_055359232.1 adrenocorticotropic hormone receptor [Betta splendens]XP_055359233.1 adrenocorticotropic hormone receptor [Betta splendens]